MNRRWIATVVFVVAMIPQLRLPAFAPCAEPERQYVKTRFQRIGILAEPFNDVRLLLGYDSYRLEEYHQRKD